MTDVTNYPFSALRYFFALSADPFSSKFDPISREKSFRRASLADLVAACAQVKKEAAESAGGGTCANVGIVKRDLLLIRCGVV